jgi:fucose permease
MFFLGFSLALVGAAARNIGLTPYEIGLLISVQFIGFGLAVFISGAMADTYEKPKILLGGSLILALSLFTFYLSGVLWINLVIMFFLGAGVGVYEGAADTMILDLHTRRATFHINVNHFFVTFGSILIAVYLIFLRLNWRISIIQAGIVVLLMALFFSLAKLNNHRHLTEPYLERLKILTRDRVVIALFAAVVLAVGAQIGTIGILTSFLTEIRGFSEIAAQVGLVIFLLGIALGRLIVGYFSKHEQISSYILALFGLSALCFAALFFLDVGPLTYLLIFLAGLAFSAVIPLIVTLAGLLYRNIAGTVLGTIKVAIPVGGIILPFLMSMIARTYSLQAALVIFPLAFLLGFFILFLAIRHIRTLEPTPAV